MSPCQPAISTIISVITITETSPFNIVHTAVQMDKLINFLKKSFIKLRTSEIKASSRLYKTSNSSNTDNMP